MINILSFVINVNDINLIYLEKIKARAFILEKISSLVSGDLFSLLFSRLGIPTLKIKVGAHETIFVNRSDRYVCGINFYAILVGRLKSGNIPNPIFDITSASEPIKIGQLKSGRMRLA